MFLIVCTLAFILLHQPSEGHSIYDALSRNNLEQIEESIARYEKSSSTSLVNAYLGALYMRRASFIKAPAEKSAAFRRGKEILETEINNHPQNAEMRLLRLMIQENCPPFLRYNGHIDEDKQFVLNTFLSLNEELKQVIRHYALSSAALKSELLP